MNAAKSFTLKVAALGITAATAFLNAQSHQLTGKVPMDFVVGGKSAPAGAYRVVEQRPGVVFVRTDEGKNIGIALMPVQTAYNATSSKLRFERSNGVVRFTGYCAEGRGCWSAAPPAQASSEKIEIALSTVR